MIDAVVKRWMTLAVVALALPQGAGATARDAGLCEDAARRAANATGVPGDVLLAITLTETGRAEGGGPLRPWPWAVNVAGEGHWFGSQAEAVRFVEDQVRAGSSNFDVGCFQLNHRWHGEAFGSARQMFDPMANALYAARYLKSLEADSGDWSAAAGAYHSGTPHYAEKYRARFDRLYAGLPAEQPAAPRMARVNRYPFLQVGDSGSGGSLVPVVAAVRPMFGD